MKTIFSLIISGALVVSGLGQTRNVLVGTNNAVVQPTNFWSADASNARTGLGLGTAATNPASAFQPSSLALTNLSANNGGGLTNLTASNIVGTLGLGQGGTGATNASDARAALSLGTASTNPASAFQPSSLVLSNLSISNGGVLTNITAANIVGVIPSSNLPSATFTNLSGTLSIAQGGTGATNAANARQNLGSTTVGDSVFVATNAEVARTALGATAVGSSVFTALDASAARTSLGLGTASTNSSSAFQPSSTILSNLSLGNGAGLTNVTASAVSSALAISNVAGLQAALDGKLATNGSAAGLISFPTVVLQTNSSLSLFPEGLLRTNGNAFGLTNFPVIPVTSGGTGGTNAQTARNGIGLGITNTLTIAGITAQNLTITAGGGITLQAVLTNAASFRTNVGLPWTGLTNTDAASFRTALGLGTASTNPSSAFQPASSALTNLVSGNGGALTNLQATNLVGIIPASNISTTTLSNISGTLPVAQGGTGATNASAARVNLGSTTVGDAVFIATNGASARTAIGATTVGSSLFTLANPSAITFLRLNADNTASALSASDFRTALSLNTAATNPSSAFQPASSALTNLSTNNGVNLTNISVAGVVGALATNGNGAGLTNLTAANITGTVGLASNVTGTIAISNGGSGATTAGGARTNLGLGATNDVFVGLSVGIQNTNLSTNEVSLFGQQNYADSSARESFAFGAANSISNMPVGAGGSIVMGVLGNMTNQGAFLFNGVPQGGTVGNSRGNNTFAVNALNGIYLNGSLFFEAIQGVATDSAILQIAAGGVVSRTMTNKSTDVPAFFGWDGFVNTAFSAAQARTNIGLSFAALTNTNTAGFNASLYGSGTNPVLVNTNGEVVSPTNFWQAAPINTVLQNITNVVGNSTNAATNARMLFLYSLAPTVTNVTSTITLPTNGSTFGGDVATITHLGPTSSVTAIRALGASTNLIALNQSEESVRFIYRDGQWKLMDNISYIEPIFFSGTNASANAAASRTNLGLGTTNNVAFSNVTASGTLTATGAVTTATNLNVGGAINVTNKAETRTNLGLGAAWLTNTDVTNFRTAIELGATNNVTFNDVTASGTMTVTGVVTALSNMEVAGALTSTGVVTAISNAVVGGTLTATGVVTALSNVEVAGTLTATSTVTAKTNLVVEGFLDFTTNHTNVAPATNNQIQKFLQIRIGTNAFFLPLYQ